MRLQSLLLAAMTVMVIGPSSAAWSQPYDPYGRRYDERRYDERRYDDRRDYRERDERWRGGDMRRGGGGVVCAREGGFCAFRGEAIVRYGAW
ncbi:MAG: hypothetical protein R3D69_18980 [Xanthobacteraceae bacterium]